MPGLTSTLRLSLIFSSQLSGPSAADSVTHVSVRCNIGALVSLPTLFGQRIRLMNNNRMTWLRRFPILINACLTLVLAGCGGSGSSSTTGTGGGQTYSLSGTVSGVDNGTLVLAVNGAQVTVAEGATSVALASGLSSGTAYTVTVTTTPTGETCSVANGTGTITSANAGNVVVTCSQQAYALGGTIAGLTQSGLVLADGSTYLSVSAGATSFTLPTPVAYSSGYTVSVLTQPSGLACSVSNGSGTMPAAAVTNVAISCTDQPFSVGGTIAGLGNSTGLVLTNGTDSRTVSAGATVFVMPTKVAFGSPYAVQVQTSPAGLACSVSGGSGTMGAANVTQVAVTCSAQSYVLSGTITGLTQSGLVLANGANTLTVTTGSGGFTLPAVAVGAGYSVQVQTNPTEETCSVSNGAGTMPASAVTDIAVTCSMNTYTVGGTVRDLARSGLVLWDNFGDPTSVAINARQFTMNTGLADGASYNVVVGTQPYGLSIGCGVSNGSGASTTDVTSIRINCGTVTPGATAIAGPFYNPVGTATDSAGDIFFISSVSGSNSGHLMEIPYSQGSYGQPVQIGTKPYMNVSTVAVDAAGDVFVNDAAFGYIWEVPYSQGSYGNPVAIITGPQYIYGMAVDAAGDVFVAVPFSNEVLEFPYVSSGSYGSSVSIGSGFNQPYAVAVDAAGDVFVADTGNNAIEEFPYSGGSYATTPVVLGSGFNGPQGVAIDAAGDVLVADTANNAIKEIPYNQGSYGTPVTLDAAFGLPLSVAVDGAGNIAADSLGGGMEAIPYRQGGYGLPVALSYPLRSPLGLAVDTAGDLLVANTDADAVLEIPSAQNGGQTMPALVASGQFVLPSGVAVDAQGNIFVADTSNNAIKEIPFTNGSYGTPVSLGNGFKFANPSGVAVDLADNLFVADTGNSAIEEIPFNPGAHGAYGSPVTLGFGFKVPCGVWVDGSDNVFVADTGNSAIKVIAYSPQLGYSLTPQTLGSGFSLPQGVVTDAIGNIYVADTGNNAVKEMANNDYGDPVEIVPGTATFSNPHALAVDANGRLYVLDDNEIWLFQP